MDIAISPHGYKYEGGWEPGFHKIVGVFFEIRITVVFLARYLGPLFSDMFRSRAHSFGHGVPALSPSTVV